MQLLVIGYGNELRGDDGAGPQAALAAARAIRARVITCHQLVPELADDISHSDAVVFVDARLGDDDGVIVQELKPGTEGELFAHRADPRSLLALAQSAFGHAPRAWWVTIPIHDTGFGRELSATATCGVALAVEQIKSIATSIR